MIKPITGKFKENKQFLMKTLPEVAAKLNMQSVGRHERLGLISFRQNSDKMIYAHIVELEPDKTLVSIAPGLSYLKDRNSNEDEKKIIKQIIVELNNVCERKQNDQQ